MSQTFLTQKGDDDITISMSDICPVSSVFQRLANDKFCAKNRCILLTVRYYWLIFICVESTSIISTAVCWVLIRRSFLQGKGYPDVATRRYLVHGIYECHTLNPISLVTSLSCQSYSLREHQEYLRGLIWLASKVISYLSSSFLRRLLDELELPVYGLMDADPYGIDILCVYHFGSLVNCYSLFWHSFDCTN